MRDLSRRGMREEWGTSENVSWPGAPGCPWTVKGYDADGNEIKNPQCDRCGAYKCQIIGTQAVAWVRMCQCK